MPRALGGSEDAMKDIPLKQLNKKELTLWNALIKKARLYAANGKRDTVYSEGWDKGASWAFAHSANVVYEQSKEPPNNGNQRELLTLRWLDFVDAAKALIYQLFKLGP